MKQQNSTHIFTSHSSFGAVQHRWCYWWFFLRLKKFGHIGCNNSTSPALVAPILNVNWGIGIARWSIMYWGSPAFENLNFVVCQSDLKCKKGKKGLQPSKKCWNLKAGSSIKSSRRSRETKWRTKIYGSNLSQVTIIEDKFKFEGLYQHCGIAASP